MESKHYNDQACRSLIAETITLALKDYQELCEAKTETFRLQNSCRDVMVAAEKKRIELFLRDWDMFDDLDLELIVNNIKHGRHYVWSYQREVKAGNQQRVR